MNDDLISRQAAIDALIDALAWTWSGTWSEKAAIDAIKQMPSAQPERKTGRWLECESYYYELHFKCSVCGKNEAMPTRMYKPIWEYCPNCGARMEVDDDCT